MKPYIISYWWAVSLLFISIPSFQVAATGQNMGVTRNHYVPQGNNSVANNHPQMPRVQGIHYADQQLPHVPNRQYTPAPVTQQPQPLFRNAVHATTPQGMAVMQDSPVENSLVADSAEACECKRCCEYEPFKLFERCDWRIGGWSQTGYHTFSTGMFNNRPNEINQHQTWVFIEKTADGSCGLDFGFRMDYVWGIDGPDTQSFGNPAGSWDEAWDNGGFYGSAIPQLYAEIAGPRGSIKVGHFYTLIGYEVVTAPDNFFYSHAFSMYNSEPFTHTGVIATVDLDKDISFTGGWTAGWDTGFDRNGGSTGLGSLSLQLTDQTELIYATTFGNIGFGTNISGYSHSIVLSSEVTDRLSSVLQWDYTDFETVNTSRALNHYLFYEVHPCLSLGSRLEWWQTHQAVGARSEIFAATFGMNIRPNANTVLRPEIRWQRDEDQVIVAAPDNEKFGFGMDMVVTF